MASGGQEGGLDVEVGVGAFVDEFAQEFAGLFFFVGEDEGFDLEFLPDGGEFGGVGFGEEAVDDVRFALTDQAHGEVGGGEDVAVERGQALQGLNGGGGFVVEGAEDGVGDDGVGFVGVGFGAVVDRFFHEFGHGGVLRGSLGGEQEDAAALAFVGAFEGGVEAFAGVGVMAAHHVAHPGDAFEGGAGDGFDFQPALVDLFGLFVSAEADGHVHRAFGHFGVAGAFEHDEIGT